MFLDGRSQTRVRHSVREMLAQRVYGLALGYEDLNDHEQLREDPLLMLLAGSADAESPLAGKSTLNRLELGGGAGEEDRYKKVHYDAEAIDRVLVHLFLEAHAQPPEEIVIDLDTTDLPLHGHQEQRFFHGFYYHYCYLPVYIVCGEHLLGVRLRPANIDASTGALEEVERIVKQIRQHWPEVKIILRADSGFCRESLMSWCEAHQSEYDSALHAMSVYAESLSHRCKQPPRYIAKLAKQRACLPSLPTKPTIAGAGHGG